MLFRQIWMTMVKKMAVNWAIVSLDRVKCQLLRLQAVDAFVLMNEVWRRQYTTNNAKTEAGSTFPRYKMYLGVGFPGRKTMKGMKRVSIVATTPAATMMIC